MKIALSTLCEHPSRKTGLTTLFHEFVEHSLAQFPDVEWIVFAGPKQEWLVGSGRVQLVREFPANDELRRRVFADLFLVCQSARNIGASAMVTVQFVPLR